MSENENMKKDKTLNYLGLAARGRMLVKGYNTCIFMISKKKVRLLILAQDLAENSIKKMVSVAEKNNIPYRIYGTKEDLSHITGNVDAGIFGLTDENLAKAILSEIDYRES
jgi:ribosomal protein L7Ae-like RNA K-turn-binding protein